MGQDPGTGGTAVSGSSQAPTSGTQDPQLIREQIDQTRQELGDTVEALSAKTDVKAQAQHKIDDVKSSVAEKKETLLIGAGALAAGLIVWLVVRR